MQRIQKVITNSLLCMNCHSSVRSSLRLVAGEKKMVIKQGVKYRLVFCHFKIGTNDGSLKESREATIVCNLLSHLEYFIGIIGVQFRH